MESGQHDSMEQCTLGNAVWNETAIKLSKVDRRAAEMQFWRCWALIPSQLSED